MFSTPLTPRHAQPAPENAIAAPPGLVSTSDGRGAVTTPPCPHCQGPTVRIGRRLIDRLSTLLRPARRYRCQSFQCQWEGNVRLKHWNPVRAPVQEWGEDDAPGSVSRVFLLSMALALAGITFILVSTYTDWLEPGGFMVSSARSPADSTLPL